MTSIDLQKAKLMGRGYVVDCCISAFNRLQEQRNIQNYLADCAYVLVKSLQPNMDLPLYKDLLNPPKEDTRSAEEIAGDVIARHGLKVVG